jgi:transcriptional regulator with XRE-family HTH domain
MGPDRPAFLRYTDGMKNRIRELREERGLSQQQLAELLVPPTSKTQISKLELSQRRLSDAWLQRLGRALACHPAELFGTLPSLSSREEAMLGIFRGLSEQDQDAFIRIGDALSKTEKTDS